MSDVSQNAKNRAPVRRQRSIYQVHYCLKRRDEEEMAKPLAVPSDPLELQAYERQVAGHQNNTSDTKYLGLLQCSGKILKPILKEAQRREVQFYERVSRAEPGAEPALAELRRHVPQYHGCRKFTYNGHQQDYIILEDLTDRMLEPCIMDVKIGKKTWHPHASPEKIAKEQSKYRQCKEEFGFCIPGYQVYRLATGRLCKYGKDCGKRLHGHMVRAAIKNFLNGETEVGGGAAGPGGVCRALLLQLLGALWALQRWAGRQRALTLRATSLLLVYDAARLRACAHDDHHPYTPHLSFGWRAGSAPPVRRQSIHSSHNPAGGAGPAGRPPAPGPRYKKVSSVGPASPPVASPWSEALEKLNLNHSFEHNYEDKLCKIKMNYRAQLEQLASDAPSPNPWGTVKLIDFAHAHFNEDADARVDDNFKEGLDGFVALFESLLGETDDQVF